MLYWGACLLTININLPTNEQDGYISNVAFFKALLIKEYIESKRLSNKCKEETMNKVLEYLQKTWIAFWRERTTAPSFKSNKSIKILESSFVWEVYLLFHRLFDGENMWD